MADDEYEIFQKGFENWNNQVGDIVTESLCLHLFHLSILVWVFGFHFKDDQRTACKNKND